LFPQDSSHRKHAASIEAQAEQANEHDEKQDDVSNEGANEVKFDDLNVGESAGIQCGTPRGADLRMRTVSLDTPNHLRINIHSRGT
jgi:hypothetical protein